MPKVTKNTPVPSPITKEGKDLITKAKDLLHEPSRTEEKMKARFWTRFKPGPLTRPEDLSASDISRILGNRSIEKQWADVSFREWFLDASEEREQVKFLFNKGLQALEHILSDPTNNSSAVVNALKLLAELNGNISKQVVEKFIDDDINKMDENQLETYLASKGVKFAHPVTEAEFEEVTKKDSEVEGD